LLDDDAGARPPSYPVSRRQSVQVLPSASSSPSILAIYQILIFVSVYTPSKNALLEFIDLSDTNYKFMDQKMHFQSLWTYVFKVYGPKKHKLQVDGPKNALLEFADLNNTPLLVSGPLVLFTLVLNISLLLS